MYHSLYIDELLAVGAAVKAGATDIARYSRPTYLKLLRLSKECTRLVFLVTGKEAARATHWRVSDLLEKLELDNANGKIRKQPLGIILFGPPGSGKTTAAIDFAITLLKAKYGKAYADEIVTLNETDSFQSEFRSNHKVVIFDDLDACRSGQPDTINPYRKILDFINNVNKTSLNPNVELKGNVYIKPDLVIVTTNMRTLNPCHYWMNCPGAIRRRFPVCIDIQRSDLGQEFLVSENVELGSTNHQSFDTHHERLEKFNVTDIELVRSFLRGVFLQHDREQEEYVKNVNNRFDETPMSGRSDLFYHIHDSIYSMIFFMKNVFRKELSIPSLKLRCENSDNQLILTPQSGIEIDQDPPGFLPTNSFNEEMYISFKRTLINDSILEICFFEGFLIWRPLSCRDVFIFCHTRVPPPIDFYNRNIEYFWQRTDTLDSFLLEKHKFKPDEALNSSQVNIHDLLQLDTIGTFSVEDDQSLDNPYKKSSEVSEKQSIECLYEVNSQDSHVSSEFTLSGYQKAALAMQQLRDIGFITQSGEPFNHLTISRSVAKFVCNSLVCDPPKTDPLMSELLSTKPSIVSLLAREWRYDGGIGDFIFYILGKVYAVEVKKTKVDYQQLARSHKALERLFGEPYVCSFAVNKQGFHSKDGLHDSLSKWENSFLQVLRCTNKPHQDITSDEV